MKMRRGNGDVDQIAGFLFVIYSPQPLQNGYCENQSQNARGVRQRVADDRLGEQACQVGFRKMSFRNVIFDELQNARQRRCVRYAPSEHAGSERRFERECFLRRRNQQHVEAQDREHE